MLMFMLLLNHYNAIMTYSDMTNTDLYMLKLQAAMALSKSGREFIGVIKMGHALFPKQYFQDILGPLPSSSRLVLTANVEGVDLVAIGYKYNRRKVLFFISTSGVANILNGEPYVQRWADDHGNLCTRNVPRPALISRYFKDPPKVDKVG